MRQIHHQDYYVYIYLRKRDLTPYYVEKGRRGRAYQKHTIKLPEDRSRVIFVATELSDVWAIALERRLIRWYGRKSNNTGILRNLTEGGEGASGYRHNDETKRKIGISQKSKIVSQETREKLSIINKLKPTRGGAKNKGKPSPLKGNRFTIEHQLNIVQQKRYAFSVPNNLQKIESKAQTAYRNGFQNAKNLL